MSQIVAYWQSAILLEFGAHSLWPEILLQRHDSFGKLKRRVLSVEEYESFAKLRIHNFLPDQTAIRHFLEHLKK